MYESWQQTTTVTRRGNTWTEEIRSDVVPPLASVVRFQCLELAVQTVKATSMGDPVQIAAAMATFVLGGPSLTQTREGS